MTGSRPLLVAPMPAELPALSGCERLACGPGPFLDGPPPLPGSGPVLVTGTCGALVDGVPRGALVLPERLVDEAGREWRPDSELHRRLADAADELGLALETGGLAAVEAVVDAREERRGLAAASGCRFVDLESAALGRAAEASGRPWVVLRFVSDGPETPLGWLAELYGALPERQPGAWQTLRALARRPSLAARLFGLARAVGAGKARARRVLRRALGPTRGGASA